ELRTVGYVALDERRLVQVQTRFGGWIERLAVRATWEPVKRGQVLATIYSPEVLTAQQELLYAERWRARDQDGGLASLQAGLPDSAREPLELLGISRADGAFVLRTRKPIR